MTTDQHSSLARLPEKKRLLSDSQLEARAFAAGWKFDDARLMWGSPVSGWFWDSHDGIHSRACTRSRRVAPLRGFGEHRGFDTELTCHDCKRPIFFEHLPEVEANMEARKECFECYSWLAYIRPVEEGDLLVGADLAGDFSTDPDKRALYKLGEMKRRGPACGFGGTIFRLQILGGPIIESFDLWRIGRVPERFLPRFPATFHFLPKE